MLTPSFEFEAVLHWTATALYVLSALAYGVRVFFSRGKAERWGAGFALAGLFPHAAALIVRWAASGHGPYMTKYEVLSSNAWVAILFFLIASWRRPRLRPAGIVVLPVCFLSMAGGLFTNPAARNLPPSLRSIWLVFHILFAKLGAGGVLLALGAAVLYLIKEGREADFARRLPPLDILDDYSRRFAGFGFFFWSVMIAAGAIWADESWGRYWAWDPIETWSLITWLALGAYLHLRRFHGLNGRKAAWLMAGCFVLSVSTLIAVPILAKGLHTEYFQ